MDKEWVGCTREKGMIGAVFVKLSIEVMERYKALKKMNVCTVGNRPHQSQKNRLMFEIKKDGVELHREN